MRVNFHGLGEEKRRSKVVIQYVPLLCVSGLIPNSTTGAGSETISPPSAEDGGGETDAKEV
jgi:hypothetical protein